MYLKSLTRSRLAQSLIPNANARWSSNYLVLLTDSIMAKSLPKRLNRSDVGMDIVEKREREIGTTECVKNVTTTNDVSANLTLRQIDLSRNPIVACCMFSRAFTFLPEIRSDLVLRSNLSARECLLTSRSVRLHFRFDKRHRTLNIIVHQQEEHWRILSNKF